MGKVIFNMTISLDGFVAGPNDSPENGLGEGGQALFDWYFSGEVAVQPSQGTPVLKLSPESARVVEEAIGNYGAGIWGRRTFDIAHAWGGHPPGSPAFILTQHPPAEWIYDGSPFTFVMDGIESAIRQAEKVAGEKDVVLCTASVLQQALNAGLVDEIHLDVAPLLLGGGVRLFDHLPGSPVALERIRAIAAPGVTHLAFRIVHV
jgi:dihydrofolate reductase